MAKREGAPPARYNVLHCHPEQLFPFLPQSGLSIYYNRSKEGMSERGGIAGTKETKTPVI